MNIQKRIAALSLIVFASCQVKEDIHVNANNSVDRNMELQMDKQAGAKLSAMAQMGGQGQLPVDSIAPLWNTITDSLTKKLEANSKGAVFSASKWDTASNSGKVNFHMPDLKTYNEFANTLAQSTDKAEAQMPFAPVQKQQLEWRGKDTLVIQLNEGKAAATGSTEEMTQGVAMIKLMLGIDALATYKASIHLPKAAKSIIATNATLSEDKKTVHIERVLDEVKADNAGDEVKVIF